VFGIRPWEWDLLSAQEALVLIRDAQTMMEEAGNG
jgi:hypothetical protein